MYNVILKIKYNEVYFSFDSITEAAGFVNDALQYADEPLEIVIRLKAEEKEENHVS